MKQAFLETKILVFLAVLALSILLILPITDAAPNKITGKSVQIPEKIIENENGKVDFGAIDVLEDDLGKYVKINKNHISVDSENAPFLNKKATLTINNLDYDFTPIILRDGEICYDCSILSYSEGVLVFTVPHFSDYTTMECSGLSEDLYLNSGSWKCNVSGVNTAKIIINNSNVELDCSGSEINGGSLGTGIFVKEPAELQDWTANGQLDLERIMTNVSSFVDSISFLSNVTIKNCIFRNFEYGANVSALTDSLIANNTFDNATAIFALKDSVIEGNEVKNSNIGLGVVGLRVIVRGNNIHNNVNGLGVLGFDNEIIENEAKYNSETGISLLFSKGAKVSGNTADSNKNGIAITESSENKISENVVINNNFGIIINGLFSEGPSYGNVIDNNVISGNTEAGMKTNDGNLGNLFRLLAGAERKSFMITGNSIVENTFDNPAKDFAVEGSGFEGNEITGNVFLGGGSDVPCSLNDCDAIVGELNTTLENVTVEVVEAVVEFKQGNEMIASFELNGTLNLSNISIGKQISGATKGYIFVKGIPLAANTTKTLYIDKIETNMNYLCVKDADINDISEITPNCNGAYETIVHCNGILSNSGYKCTDNGDQFVVEGLKHSGVIQYEPDFRYVNIQLVGLEEYENLNLKTVAYPWDNPTFMGAHSGPETNCSGAGCWSRYIEKKTFNFNVTDGTSQIGTIQLDGTFFATTKIDQITYTGISMIWGTANLNFVFNGTTYTGQYTIAGEEWPEWEGVLAVINETGENIYVTQFTVNMSKSLSNNEIKIRANPKTIVHKLSNQVSYHVSVNGFGTFEYIDGYETFKENLNSTNSVYVLPNILNRTTFIGTVKSTDLNGNITIIDGWGKSWYDNSTGKYQRVFYGYPVEAYTPNITCTLDSDCGSSSTCINKATTESYCSYGPLVNGTIYDENGAPSVGLNISFYEVTSYDPALDSTWNDTTLIPKAIPDVITDANGYYSVYLPDNTIWHMVMQGSQKTDYNVHTNKTNKGKGHDSEIYENESYDPNTDFNVEGHILHSGAYEHGNKYICTEFVEFTMFGMNKGASDVTIRYVVENHTETGTPTDNRWVCGNETDPIEGFINDTDIHYCSYNNATETLYLPADGKKYKKDFAFEIPCDWESGKYDIHVYDNQKWGKMHKIGNFFIVNDNESFPTIELGEDLNLLLNSSGLYMYTDDLVDLPFKSKDVYNGTIPNMENYTFTTLTIAQEIDYVFCDINVTLDKDIYDDSNSDGNASNDVDYSECGGTNQRMWNVSYFEFNNDIYNISRVHNARLTATDKVGKSTYNDINITVWITEPEAYGLGWDLGYNHTPGIYFYLQNSLLTINKPGVPEYQLYADGYDGGTISTGFEYLTKHDGYEPVLTENQIYWLNYDINRECGSISRPIIKPIRSSIAQDFENELGTFIYKIKNTCGFT